MAIQTKIAHPAVGMSYEHAFDSATEDPADRVSLRAFFNDQKTAFDYFTEEKPVYGLSRIGMKFRLNRRGAN
jgi:hypothetical protein